MLREIDLGHELARIKNLGYVPARRGGDSSVGDTLEYQLGLKPTSKAGVADLLYNGIPTELKARRKDSDSKTSLFGCEATIRTLTAKQLVQSYGQSNAKHVRGLFVEVSSNGGNTLGFRLSVDSNARLLHLLSPTSETLWTWAEQDLAKKIVNQLVIVEADSTGIGVNERFRYESATLYRDLRPGAFLGLLADGLVVINIRARFKRSLTDWKNHGTAFRSDRSDALANCYAHMEKIL